MQKVDHFLWLTKARRLFGVTGQGLTVAVLDTGLNAGHVDFAQRVLPGRNFTKDGSGDPNDITDGNGHGTNVSGIILASGDHIGVAPGARIIPLKVLGNRGDGSFEVIEQALAWVLQNHAEHNISVVCVSMGDNGNYTSDEAFFSRLLSKQIADLRAARVAVVAPVGNNYGRAQTQQGMCYPAIIRQVISVGVVYSKAIGAYKYGSGTEVFSTRAGQLAPFCQRLHETVNGVNYTTIFAPGAPVTATGINGPHGEAVQHGSTMATGVIAGIILLLQELSMQMTGALPSVDELVQWLRRGSVTIFDGDDEDDNVAHTLLAYPCVDGLLALYEARRALRAAFTQRRLQP